MARTPDKATKTIGHVRIVPRLRNGNEQWRVLWTDATGRQRERTASSEQAADLIAAEVLVTSDEAAAPSLNIDATWSDLFSDYLNPDNHADWRSPGTAPRYASLINNHLRPVLVGPCRGTTAARMNKVLQAIADEGYASRMVKDVTATLGSVVRWGQAVGVWSPFETPLAGVACPVAGGITYGTDLIDRSVKVPGPSQVEALMVALAVLDADYPLMAGLASEAGLRIGEVLAAMPGDFNVKARTMFVQRQLVRTAGETHVTLPKHGKTRTTVVGEELMDALAPVLARARRGNKVGRRTPDGPCRELATNALFLNAHNNLWTGTHWGDRALSKARAASEYPDHMTTHSLRHFWICQLLDSNVRVASVSKMAGHHSVRFTMDKYVGADSDYLDEAFKATAC